MDASHRSLLGATSEGATSEVQFMYQQRGGIERQGKLHLRQSPRYTDHFWVLQVRYSSCINKEEV